MHFQCFFYLITYNHEADRGWWWKGHYAPLQAISKNDWGNDVSLGFMVSTQEWEHRVLAITAHEHFKLAIRKHPTADVWSLAVEWNENYRVFAACGEEKPLRAFLDDFPKLKIQTVHQTPDSRLQVRTENSLNPQDDTLFTVPLAPGASRTAVKSESVIIFCARMIVTMTLIVVNDDTSVTDDAGDRAAATVAAAADDSSYPASPVALA